MNFDNERSNIFSVDKLKVIKYKISPMKYIITTKKNPNSALYCSLLKRTKIIPIKITEIYNAIKTMANIGLNVMD